MIRHTVAFRLKHSAGSPEEQNFLQAGRELAKIPAVRNFECLRQISSKSAFNFGFSMEFDDRAGYDAYNAHPYHVQFVEARWLGEVDDFQELDYERI